MNLCSDGHEEICYEGMRCPICDLIQENFDKNKDEISLFEDEIKKLKDQIDLLMPED